MKIRVIIASGESTSGNMKKLLSMFNKIASPIDRQKQIKYIEEYIKDKKLRDTLKNNIPV